MYLSVWTYWAEGRIPIDWQAVAVICGVFENDKMSKKILADEKENKNGIL